MTTPTMATPTIAPAGQHVDRRPSVEPQPRDHAWLDGRPRQDVALCASYAEAELVLDRLGDTGFPAGHVTVMADGGAERGWAPTRRGTGPAAVHGLVVGGAAGSVAGALSGLSHPDPVITALVTGLYGLALGALAGAALAVLVHVFRREPVKRTTHHSVAGDTTGISAATPGGSGYVVVADDPSTWVRAVTALYGGGEYRPVPAGDCETTPACSPRSTTRRSARSATSPGLLLRAPRQHGAEAGPWGSIASNG
jgi:hypothetical protein